MHVAYADECVYLL